MGLMLGPHKIDVVRAGSKQSDYGTTQVADWSSSTSTRVDGCSVQPADAVEYTQDRDSTMTRWVVFAPIDADIESTDRVVFDGETYDVDGDVQRWSFGQLAHQVVNLRRSRDA